ncbi:MAG TPA: arginine repressor [Euzebya sp.]|nr:arginine repressor [Euzebya sp.]
MRTADRTTRQQLVRDLVSTYQVASQSELVQLLAAHDVEVNQATVSRDLEQLGIGKVRGADGILAYGLPERGGLAQLLRQFVTDIDASGNLAVVRTPPGAAATVASAIDTDDVDGVLATLQGDDTVLVVAREPHDGHHVAASLRAIKAPPIPGSSDGPSRAERSDPPTHFPPTQIPSKADPSNARNTTP